MVMKCIVADGSYDGLEMYRKVFICRAAVLCKLLGVVHHLKSHWHWELGLWWHCHDFFCQVLTVGLGVIGW